MSSDTSSATTPIAASASTACLVTGWSLKSLMTPTLIDARSNGPVPEPELELELELESELVMSLSEAPNTSTFSMKNLISSHFAANTPTQSRLLPYEISP